MQGERDLGVLIIAAGHQRYIDQALVLCASLRINMPGLPIAVVTDSAQLGGVADVVVPVDREWPMATCQKLLLDRYTPFKETLFIDSDCVVTRPFDDSLAGLRQYEFSPVGQSLTLPDGRDEYVTNMKATLAMVGGTAFPKFNGGVYFFKSGPLASEIFELSRQYFLQAKEFGLISFDKAGPGDETVIALAMARKGVLDLFDDKGRLMRVPVLARGKLQIDPIGGGCTFERPEGPVAPAICHFAGHYLRTAEYLLTCESVMRRVPMARLDLLTRLRCQAQAAQMKLSTFIKYKKDGIRKRLDKLRAPRKPGSPEKSLP